jgi:hypothetical protein
LRAAGILSFFGKFNPYKELIQGDWFVPGTKERKYLRGAVYLNGDWLMEAGKKRKWLKLLMRNVHFGVRALMQTVLAFGTI